MRTAKMAFANYLEPSFGQYPTQSEFKTLVAEIIIHKIQKGDTSIHFDDLDKSQQINLAFCFLYDPDNSDLAEELLCSSILDKTYDWVGEFTKKDSEIMYQTILKNYIDYVKRKINDYLQHRFTLENIEDTRAEREENEEFWDEVEADMG